MDNNGASEHFDMVKLQTFVKFSLSLSSASFAIGNIICDIFMVWME